MNLAYVEVHLALLVLEDAQTKQLLNHVVCRSWGIRFADSEQHQQPASDAPDFAVSHSYVCSCDSLDDGAHESKQSAVSNQRLAIAEEYKARSGILHSTPVNCFLVIAYCCLSI